MADPSRPFVLSEKLSIKGKETLRLYAEDIEAAYASLSAPVDFSVQPPVDWDYGNVSSRLSTLLTEVCRINVIDHDANLFECGMDSLHAISLRSFIISLGQSAGVPSERIPHLVAYRYPTVKELSGFIILLAKGQTTSSESDESDLLRLDRAIQTFEGHVSSYLPRQVISESEQPVEPQPTRAVVILTGSTGSLGSHILSALITDGAVEKIYCFTRHAVNETVKKQRAKLQFFGLDVDAYDKCVESGRIVQLFTDLRHSSLGLTPKMYRQLQSEATHIVHCAWQVNFNLGLRHFVGNDLAGLAHFADFLLSSSKSPPPSFVFISSISAALGAEREVRETSLPVPATLPKESSGYGLSKLAAEQMLEHLSSLGVPVRIIRTGQLSGNSRTGAWSSSEHIPMLIDASARVSAIPTDLPAIRWCPLDCAASVMVDITLSPLPSSQCCAFWNVEGPLVAPWSDVVDLAAQISDGGLERTTMDVWIERLRVSTSSIPALKLTPFYLGLSHSGSTTNGPTLKISHRMLKGVTELEDRTSFSEVLHRYVMFSLQNP